MITLILLMMTIKTVNADTWLCDEASVIRRGTSLLACGIGQDEQEDVARSKALDNSKDRFESICQDSDDCVNHRIRVVPNRTTCDVSGNTYVCKILMTFEIGTTNPRSRVKRAYQPTTEEKNRLYGNIKLGMSVKKLVAAIGTPDGSESNPSYDNRFYLNFHGIVCDGPVCAVTVENGRVIEFDKMNPRLMTW